ncbi:hypothetical protein D3C79_885360 [compost metagenome]
MLPSSSAPVACAARSRVTLPLPVARQVRPLPCSSADNAASGSCRPLMPRLLLPSTRLPSKITCNPPCAARRLSALANGCGAMSKSRGSAMAKAGIKAHSNEIDALQKCARYINTPPYSNTKHSFL